jgi:predicted DNA-binding transcriptional regulator AlpA
MRNENSDRLIDKTQLRTVFPASGSTVRRLELRGEFPARIYIGKRAFWRESDVQAFIQNLKG